MNDTTLTIFFIVSLITFITAVCIVVPMLLNDKVEDNYDNFLKRLNQVKGPDEVTPDGI